MYWLLAEAAKWEKITYLGIISCSALALYNLSKGHPHYDEPPVSFLFPYFTVLLFSDYSYSSIVL